ncbi:hypothetical protein CK203_085758 [Vitis vinifera]|uniref:Uncharacterized protein n=1 Tax=Vitis vinifera TaxID=29760 RepID=A0A438E315_VITVI|nr:hypothetical protein CK203_085758 [Vitis vinifera]
MENLLKQISIRPGLENDSQFYSKLFILISNPSGENHPYYFVLGRDFLVQGKETKKQAAVESEKFHSKELRLSKEMETLMVDFAERKGLSWLSRQFASRMSRGHDLENDSEYATAVAAAAYAVHSLEETRIPDQKKKSEGPEPSPTRAISKKEGTTSAVLDPGRSSRRLSGEASLRISDGKERRAPIKTAEKTTPPPPPPPPPPPHQYKKLQQ